jgi:cytochrome c biogenesis protein CcmG/thiol:disulfide interchange protein DsbE
MSGTDAPAPSHRARRRWWGVLVLVVLVALTGIVLAEPFRDEDPARSVLLGRPAPPLVGPTLDGERFDLADWEGEIVLVNVWASWCAPCRRELPLLASAHDVLGPRGLRIVGINVRESPEAARAFLEEYGGMAWPSVLDQDGTRAVDWGTFALPETYLVGRDGTIVAKAVGEIDAAWIDQNVVPLLGGAP